MKKGIELSLSTMVVAVLVIVVMIVLIMVFTGGIKGLKNVFVGTTECTSQGSGSSCVGSADACTDGIPQRGMCKNDQYCCVRNTRR